MFHLILLSLLYAPKTKYLVADSPWQIIQAKAAKCPYTSVILLLPCFNILRGYLFYRMILDCSTHMEQEISFCYISPFRWALGVIVHFTVITVTACAFFPFILWVSVRSPLIYPSLPRDQRASWEGERGEWKRRLKTQHSKN